MIRALNCYNDLCLYKSLVNRNDNLWLSLTSKWNKANCQLPKTTITRSSNEILQHQRWSFLNHLKHLMSTVLIDVNRYYQTLILLKHKPVWLFSLANWDEMYATSLHATRAVALAALLHLLGTWCAPAFKLTFSKATDHAVWITNIKMNCNNLGLNRQQHILSHKQQLWSTLRKIRMLIRSAVLWGVVMYEKSSFQ